MAMTEREALSQGWGNRAKDFTAWWNKVDALCIAALSLGLDDFPDWDFASAFESGMTPRDAFNAFKEDTLEDMGFDPDMFD